MMAAWGVLAITGNTHAGPEYRLKRKRKSRRREPFLWGKNAEQVYEYSGGHDWTWHWCGDYRICRQCGVSQPLASYQKWTCDQRSENGG